MNGVAYDRHRLLRWYLQHGKAQSLMECDGPQRKGAFRRPTDLACTTHNFIARHIIGTPQLHVTLSDRALLPPLAIVRAPIWRLRTRATVAELSLRFGVGTVGLHGKTARNTFRCNTRKCEPSISTSKCRCGGKSAVPSIHANKLQGGDIISPACVAVSLISFNSLLRLSGN